MEINEAALIEKEITLRNLRISKEVLETKRSMARWLALTLGVINPGESRLSAIAVLDALVYFQFIKKADPDIEEIKEYISKNWDAINEKTLRYHLLRMKNMGFIENSKSRFYFVHPQIGDRYDSSAWAEFVFNNQWKEIASKIDNVIGELKKREM
jgi:hypothetical protein